MSHDLEPVKPRESIYNTRPDAPPGTRIIIGPAYQGGGAYAADSCTGAATIVRRWGPAPAQDYAIRMGDGVGPWQYVVHVSRIRLAVSP